MDQFAPSRLTLRQRWYRLRTSPRFPFFVLLGLLASGVLVQVYYYWWDVRVVEMLARNKGEAERIRIYPDWVKKSLGWKFVTRFEPVRVVSLHLDPNSGGDHRPGDIGLLRGAMFLQDLRLFGPLTDDDVEHLKRLTQLKTFWCWPHPESAIDAVAELPNLTSLHLSFDDEPDPSVFRRIAAMPRLERLSIGVIIEKRGPKTVEGMRELARSQTVRRLAIHVNNAEFLALTDPSPDGTLPLPALTELRITGGDVAEQGLGNLKHFPNLVHLDLSVRPITNGHLQALKQLHQLQDLNLQGAREITDEGFDILLSLRNLQSINVLSTNVSWDGLLRLATLPQLRCLRVHPGSLEAITELRKHLPEGCELKFN